MIKSTWIIVVVVMVVFFLIEVASWVAYSGLGSG